MLSQKSSADVTPAGRVYPASVALVSSKQWPAVRKRLGVTNVPVHQRSLDTVPPAPLSQRRLPTASASRSTVALPSSTSWRLSAPQMSLSSTSAPAGSGSDRGIGGSPGGVPQAGRRRSAQRRVTAGRFIGGAPSAGGREGRPAGAGA